MEAELGAAGLFGHPVAVLQVVLEQQGLKAAARGCGSDLGSHVSRAAGGMHFLLAAERG